MLALVTLVGLRRSRQGEGRRGNDARVRGEQQPILPPQRPTPLCCLSVVADASRGQTETEQSEQRWLRAEIGLGFLHFRAP